MIDELSLGLAPLIVERLLEAVRGAARSGIGVVLVEQHVEQALRHADRAYVMRRGRIILSGSCEEVSGRIRDLEESYLAA
jgi:branched-chain amino acid transport system ATP-binding protein